MASLVRLQVMSGGQMRVPSTPPQLVPCDLTAPQISRTDFIAQPIHELSEVPLHVPGLCHMRWQWFQALTTRERTVTEYVQEIVPVSEGGDEIVRTVRRQRTIMERHAVVVQFDGHWIRQADRFATSDVIVVNGEDALPENWDVPAVFNPSLAAAQADAGRVVYRPNVDSLTLTLGHSATLGTLGCASEVHPLVLVGVRCIWGQQIGCPFDVAVTRIPRRVTDGDVITAPIEPGQLHHFAIDIGGFDTLSLSLRRIGEGIAYEDEVRHASCAVEHLEPNAAPRRNLRIER